MFQIIDNIDVIVPQKLPKNINRIIIIGNGFDLAHNLPTTYNNLKNIMHNQNPEIAKLMSVLFGNDTNWSSAEANFGHTQVEVGTDGKIAADSIQAAAKILAFDDLPDDSYELAKLTFSEVQKGLHTMALQANRFLHITRQIDKYKSFFTDDTYFINFNYTSTLENLYGIPTSNVLHIHGKAVDSTSQKLFFGGVGTSYRGIDYPSKQENLLRDVVASTLSWSKPTDALQVKIQLLQPVIASATSIAVIGHSLSEVDASYFRLIHNLNSNLAWYLDPFNKSAARDSFTKLHLKVPASWIEYPI